MDDDIAAALETSPPEGEVAAPSVRLVEVPASGTPVLNPKFDVRNLDANAIATLETAKKQLDRGLKMRRQADLEIAGALLAIRDTIPGRWLDFVDLHYPWMSHRLAQLYLGRARLVEEYENFSHGMPATALDLLAHEPQEVKQQISDHIESGGRRLKRTEVKAFIQMAKGTIDKAKKEIDRLESGIESGALQTSSYGDRVKAIELLYDRYEDDHPGLVHLAWEVGWTWLHEQLEGVPPSEEETARVRECLQLKAKIKQLEAEVSELKAEKADLKRKLEQRHAAE